eukprot:403341327
MQSQKDGFQSFNQNRQFSGEIDSPEIKTDQEDLIKAYQKLIDQINIVEEKEIENKQMDIMEYYESNKVKQIVNNLHMNQEVLNQFNSKQVWTLEEDVVVQILQDCQTTYRTILKRLALNPTQYPMLRLLNEVWNSLVFLIDHFYTYTDRILDKKYQKLDGVIRLKELVLRRQKNIYMKEMEIREKKSQEEIQKLKTALERALQSKRDLEEQLRQKEHEISDLTDPQGIKEIHGMMNNLDFEFSQIIAGQQEKEQQTKDLLGFLHELKLFEQKNKKEAQAPKISIPRRINRRNSQKQFSKSDLMDIQYRDRIIIKVQKEFVAQIQSVMRNVPDQIQDNSGLISQKVMEDVFKKIQQKNLEQFNDSPQPIYKKQNRYKSLNKQQKNSSTSKNNKSKTKQQKGKKKKPVDDEYDSEVEYDYEVDSFGSNSSLRGQLTLKKPPTIMIDQEVQTDEINLGMKQDVQDMNNSMYQPQKQNVLQKALRRFNKGKNDKIAMPQNNIYQILEQAMEEKYKYDQKLEKEEAFPKFSYDYLIMHYGLKTIALKNLGSISLVKQIQTINNSQQGLRNLIKEKKNTFAALLIRILGFEDPLKNDESHIMIKSRKFFNEVQTLWVSKMVDKTKEKFKEENSQNFQTGGICSVFELQDHLIKCLEKQNYVLLEEFICQIKPESLMQREDGASISINPDNSFDMSSQQKMKLDFILMRIVHRILKSGKDIKFQLDNIFRHSNDPLDKSMSAEQFAQEANKVLNVFITNEEINLINTSLCQNNKITQQLLMSKIKENAYQSKLNDVSLNIYTNKSRFIRICFKMWERKKRIEKDKLLLVFHQFDDNGDGVLELKEFEVLMHHFDNTLQKKQIAHFFNQTLEMVQSENPDEMSPDAFCEMMIEHKIGGYGKDYMTTQYIDQVLVAKSKQVKDSKKTGQNLNPQF